MRTRLARVAGNCDRHPPPPHEPDRIHNQYIAEQHARLAAVLDRDHEEPGAAGIFNPALSCGLTAIVKQPGPETKSGRAG